MAEDGPLGSARRAGCEDDVGVIRLSYARVRVAGVERREFGPDGAETHDGRQRLALLLDSRGERGHLAGGEDQRRPGVGEHVEQAAGRVGRVEEHPRGPRLPGGEHPDEDLGATRHVQRDAVARNDPERDEVAGELVCLLVQLRVTQRHARELDGRRVRRLRGLHLEARREDLGRERHRGRFAEGEELLPGARREHRHIDERLLGREADAFEEGVELRGEAFDRGAVEQVGVVAESRG